MKAFYIVLSTIAIPCLAATITVDDDGPADFSTIQDAIDASNDGDEVLVADGTYTGPGNRDISFKGKAITVRSTDPSDPDVVAATVIDCQSMGRGFIFNNNETEDSILAGIKIVNGFTDGEGGGIYCKAISPIIDSCIISNCQAIEMGGGIYSGGRPIIKDCIISNNMSNSHGGGITAWLSYPAIIGCRITDNVATGFGGGIHVHAYNDPTTIKDCHISGNVAGWSGGGIYTAWKTHVVVENCMIVGNIADDEGGGVLFDGDRSTQDLIGCTISGNRANIGGGFKGKHIRYVTIENCIIRSNTAAQGPQIDIDGEGNPFIGYGDAFIEFSDIEGGIDQITQHTIDLFWGLGNIDIDPEFITAGFWDPNGTSDDTADDFWVDGDYHLKSEYGRWDPLLERWIFDDVTSLCIDSGHPESDWHDELYPHGKRINMGAFGGTPQASMSSSDAGNIADFDHDDSVGLPDLSAFTDDWLKAQNLLPTDLDRNGRVDINDLAILSNMW